MNTLFNQTKPGRPIKKSAPDLKTTVPALNYLSMYMVTYQTTMKVNGNPIVVTKKIYVEQDKFTKEKVEQWEKDWLKNFQETDNESTQTIEVVITSVSKLDK